MQTSRHIKVIQHAIFWFIWMGTAILVTYVMGYPFNYVPFAINFSSSIALFYFCWAVLLKGVFLDKRTRLKRVWGLVLFFPVFHVIRFSLFNFAIGVFDIKMLFSSREGIGLSLSYYIQYTIFAVGYSYFLYSLERQKRIQELEINNRQLEIQQLHTEFNFLKAQITPIFYTIR